MIDANYLLSVKALLTKKYSKDIISLILFGSMVEDDRNTDSSTDIDLIVVLKDSCPKKIRSDLYRELLGIQQRYGMYTSGFKDFFINGLQNATGMFVNSFLCYQSDIQCRNFYTTFNVNKFFAFFLAPQSSVWISLKKRHKIIMGQDIFKEWHGELVVSTSDLIRSFLMNSLLSMGALCLSTLGFDLSHFAMESVKWSLFTWKNQKRINSTKLIEICKIYGSRASKIENRTLSAFLVYRKTKKPNPYLLMLAPIFIFKLHYSLGKKEDYQR